MTLRRRLILTLAPLVFLLAGLGGAGIVLMYRVSGRIDDILHQNYDSVVYMVDLNDALEDVDASFKLAMLGKTKEAGERYERGWKAYRIHLDKERANITLPGEGELVERLVTLGERYHAEGGAFFQAAEADRAGLYFGSTHGPSLAERFDELKRVATDILYLNQRNMVEASQDARAAARAARNWLAVGWAAGTLLAGYLTLRTLNAILRPLQTLTESALAVGSGDLNQAVPVNADDELGRLAQAFNRMTGQLRDYRQSASARLLRAQRTSQATIDSFPDPVVVVDPAGRVEMANPAARQVLGIASALGGGADRTAVPWQPPEGLREPLAGALQGQRPFLTQAFDQTVTFRLAGEDRAYLPQVLPIQDPSGNTLGAAVVLNDVTRFRLMDQVKTDLVATVSHELKTPLTSVRLALHLLLEETVGPLTPKQVELLVDARDNAERLLTMIEHLLALARLEQGSEPLVVHAISPQSLLQTAAETLRPRAADKHVEFAVGDASALPDVAADPQRLGYALNNLLDNALTYTEQGGRISLTAEPVGCDQVRFTVSDTGMGIPPEFLPHVFDKFFRVPVQSRGQGTGLGLAIVQEIATAHRGRVDVESTPGRGTVFHLTLPVWGDQHGRS